MSKKVTILTFTDPMMGLSYECEPIFRKLETHLYGDVDFKYLMNVLVKNVYDLVDPVDLSVSRELAIKNYNLKLAKIYESEENLTGMPINMTNLQLFSVEHTSSLPLNLAYKAAQLVDESKADLFLYNLRYATIVECRPTTQTKEILKVVKNTNIDEQSFLKYFQSCEVTSALDMDLKFSRRLGIRTLPAYLIEYDGEGALFQELLGYDAFITIIDRLTKGAIKPKIVEKTTKNLRELIRRHPLISIIEIREAFDFSNIDEAINFIAPLIESREVKIIEAKNSFFIKNTQ